MAVYNRNDGMKSLREGQPRLRASRMLEFAGVTVIGAVFLSYYFYLMYQASSMRPIWLDNWFMCYSLEYQITRIFQTNGTGFWEGGIYFPFHKTSLLFDCPAFGVALFMAPFWCVTKNIFLLFRLGSAYSLLLIWVCTYYFVRRLGCSKIWALWAVAVFCTSGVTLILAGQYEFWALLLIPLLGIITVKIFSTHRLYWGVLWGLMYGYLAWSSLHIFVMGGVFLALFIVWSIAYTDRSKGTVLALLIAFIVSGIIAGAIIAPLYTTHKEFGFFRGHLEPYQYASNFANLFYRQWPRLEFNPLTKTPFWEYLIMHARGETPIGMPVLLVLAAASAIVARLALSGAPFKKGGFSATAFATILFASFLLALLNMWSLTVRWAQLSKPLPHLAVAVTYACYICAGIVFFFLRRRIRKASEHEDFFFLLCAVVFGLLAFGPYYVLPNNQIVASPISILQYHVPGFSGIRATARWGLLLCFSLSIAVALFFSKIAKSRKLKVIGYILMIVSLIEVSPGFRFSVIEGFSTYAWKPRQTDLFLKELPGRGAVLEMSSYPIKQEQRVLSDNSLGYAVFSSLYHKKPLVTGYSSFSPHVTNRYLFIPDDETLSAERVRVLRKFGAQYWVFHIEEWPPEQVEALEDAVTGLNKIAELDDGKTLIYEDPDPHASVGYLDVI